MTSFLDIKELCAGLEEEGVPYHVKQSNDCKNGLIPLQVKIIIEGEKMKVYHEKLEKPYITETKGNERKLGKNAARLVKGLPLI
ncbi:glycerol dehydratase reactivase beta/small subunit family protein [Alkalihalobacterium alkalinitrilicum]|uniref:glycerol dehydratase reactivase beta/small subunit family protein n=1 Tax=Alkalihalobacterium alkalinitrilicum TaxID=427920 RepID=UPI001303819A|nr:glycerol dehydratase reactivase beta/small subunit family protein [Alkalihalobacterium alkalinitrilicum]